MRCILGRIIRLIVVDERDNYMGDATILIVQMVIRLLLYIYMGEIISVDSASGNHRETLPRFFVKSAGF